MTRIGMHEAKTKLSQLVARAEDGEEIVITRNGRPTVTLVPVPPKQPVSNAFGIFKGRIRIAEDFDELPADIAQAFGIE